jgi:hypothetical protein
MRVSMLTRLFEFELSGRDLFIRIMRSELHWEFGARPIFSR